jgi:hypothetical protein
MTVPWILRARTQMSTCARAIRTVFYCDGRISVGKKSTVPRPNADEEARDRQHSHPIDAAEDRSRTINVSYAATDVGKALVYT